MKTFFEFIKSEEIFKWFKKPPKPELTYESTEMLNNFYQDVFSGEVDKSTLNALSDWLQDQGDPFGEQMYNVLRTGLINQNYIPEGYQGRTAGYFCHVMVNSSGPAHHHYTFMNTSTGPHAGMISVSTTYCHNGVLEYSGAYTHKMYGSDPVEICPENIDDFKNIASIYISGDSRGYHNVPGQVVRSIILCLCKLRH